MVRRRRGLMVRCLVPQGIGLRRAQIAETRMISGTLSSRSTGGRVTTVSRRLLAWSRMDEAGDLLAASLVLEGNAHQRLCCRVLQGTVAVQGGP